MFEHKRVQNLEDFFRDLSERPYRNVFFYRICGYSLEIQKFISRYYEEARRSGVVIEGRIPNPSEGNLSYYNEMMGMEFQMNPGFLSERLGKWLPRMNQQQRQSVAICIYDVLDEMRRSGKNENMLKNAYIKFMCWLYYKFERIVNCLGDNKVPKILYEANISNYELKFLHVLSKAGCDIVLLQYHGDDEYLKLDPKSEISCIYSENGMAAFPEDFSLQMLRKEIVRDQQIQRLYGIPPELSRCTNAWMKGEGLKEVLLSGDARGKDKRFFYNSFLRIEGVEDKLTYINELFQFHQQLKNSGRKLVILEKKIPLPDMDEIGQIHRETYGSVEQLLAHLSANIQYPANTELQRLMVKAFVDVILEESQSSQFNLHKLTNQAVYLLCWLKRYQGPLFSDWKMSQIACLVYLGGCRNLQETLFLKMMAKLPVDVVILTPDLGNKCKLQDAVLFEIHNAESMTVEEFPDESGEVKVGTAAYHAQRELDTLLYQDSGMYRSMQYDKAVTVSLQTTYEEIAILWNQEVKYRPNFSIVDGTVNLPVIFAKVCGVKNAEVPQYWAKIKELLVENTLVVKNRPMVQGTDANPVKPFATEFLKNGKLQRAKIKNHKSYQYGVLREGMQEYILDKLQTLIDQRLIKGTFQNGTEYTIVSTVLNMGRDTIRLLQKFDFTKKNPKLVYINTTERMITLEDSILVMYLNLVGFDVVFYIPTGYQNVEKYFAKAMMEEHQLGEYLYDLQIPDFESPLSGVYQSLIGKIFKRTT